MRALYAHNLDTLFGALQYCAERDIGLYRVTSDLFPMSDYALGQKLIAELSPGMAEFAIRANRMRIRILIHPDQYVVLSSLSAKVVANSMMILEHHARVFDLLGLPRSPWAAIILHGGKGGRHDALKRIIPKLPESVRTRLVLENDEHAYGAEEILDICRTTGIPMVFDIHHHLVKEDLPDYEHPGIALLLKAARGTWPVANWQIIHIIHISNGEKSLHDTRHSEVIDVMPRAALQSEWIEVEAKGKELAIERLRARYPDLR
jgi:UV DNA damage endonuclease